MEQSIFTYLIIGFTCLVSYMALNNTEIRGRLIHYPYQEDRSKEYFRMLTAGFLHGDFNHLLFNMLTLYFFGPVVESWFKYIFAPMGQIIYLLFYLAAIVAASIATFYKHKNNPSFASLGASGAVSAVLYAAILLNPGMSLYMFFIPVPIPGFIYGILYLWYSSYAAKQGNDNIDHTAHIYGALFGFFFPIILQPSLGLSFISQLIDWFGSF
jgi:membrane associated rhomboid family serine protease